MEFDAVDPGPRDPSLLHLQATHRSQAVWRVGGGDSQRFRRRNPNQSSLPALNHRMIPLLQSTGFYGVSRVSSLQLDWGLLSALVERWRPETHTFHFPMGECTVTLQDVAVILGLPIDGNPVMCDASPAPNMSWADTAGSIFGFVPTKDCFNGSRLQLSWFASVTPHRLSEHASEADVLHHTRCYLIQLIGGSLFTDTSGGLIHCMWVQFVRDLAACGGYAWGPAVLAFLYRELCKGSKRDKEEVAGCLLLLQLWAWERLPTLAPIRTSQPLVDDQFWVGPRATWSESLCCVPRWLVGHSFADKAGRTVSVTRTVLDQLATSHFIWEPYSRDVIDGLPAYCLTNQHIWRYRGPMICVFIVEPHMPNRAVDPGPRDPSLLHLQATHRSQAIWRVGGGDSQRFRRRNPNQSSLPALNHRMIPLLQSTGFYGVSRVSSLQLDWGLLSALVERWRPETHTFHFPMGECTVTLQDVAVILGLPIDGNPVMCDASPAPNMSWADTAGSIFGFVPTKDCFNGSRLQLNWFASVTPHRLSEHASEADVLHHTRCYLIQLIGGSLFTDTSGGLIHCMWVQFVRDLAACGGYAWGPAVLAFLYRELCKGSKRDKEEVAGCLLLLQLWAWERLPTLAPIRTSQPLVDDQFWVGPRATWSEAVDPGPRDPSLLHLQATHRSQAVWRVGGGDSQRFRRRNPNQSSLPALNHRMIPLLQSTGFYGVSRVSSLQLDWGLLSALVERWRPETHTFHFPMGECTVTLQDVAVILGLPIDGNPVMCDASPAPNMSWADTAGSIFGFVPTKDCFNGSRLQLSWFASVTPHRLSEHASEADVLHHTRCYLIQLIGGSLFTDTSGGLIHCMWVQFVRDLAACGGYAWGPAVLAFLYRELCKGSKRDKEELMISFGWVPGPLGVRWLVGHSFADKAGRTVSVTRTVLDQLATSHFIWEPYSRDVIDGLPAYCLTNQHIWRYRGPMICVFIVEPHMPDRGGLLKTIADRTQEVLPDVLLLATQGFNDIQNHSLYGFEAFPLEERRDKEKEWRQDVGRRRKRGAGGGHGGGRSTRRRVGNEAIDKVVPPPEDQLVDPSHDQGKDDHVATNLEDVRDPLVHEDSNIDVPEAPTDVQPAPVVIPEMPSFDSGLTPTPQPNQQHSTTQQPPPLQPTHRPPHKPILSYPTFDLGITPPSDDSNAVASSQSTESSQPSLTQASESSNLSPSGRTNKFQKVYEPRRSKRVPKPTKCGTDGEKCRKK
ncbi:hypothetical protein POM88_035793 [Heracleum sosnowskyi]|uniref:Aminotransferase-like plant mobile domain-containing protein n=1 Tax=Heracleum sosnowskyi TaxID=360622 RepID=A0AAD8HN36_9APIA|nr:hypothetical protein POM88_035793 [Heracleum sosnowskyi]